MIQPPFLFCFKKLEDELHTLCPFRVFTLIPVRHDTHFTDSLSNVIRRSPQGKSIGLEKSIPISPKELERHTAQGRQWRVTGFRDCEDWLLSMRVSGY